MITLSHNASMRFKDENIKPNYNLLTETLKLVVDDFKSHNLMTEYALVLRVIYETGDIICETDAPLDEYSVKALDNLLLHIVYCIYVRMESDKKIKTGDVE